MDVQSKPMRRNSAAGRAVNAAQQSSLQLTPSPSPLLSRATLATAPRKLARIDPRVFEEEVPLPEGATSSVVELSNKLEALRPVPPPIDALKPLSNDAVALIAQFVACDDVRGAASLAAVCRRFHVATLAVIRHVTVVPNIVSMDALSRPGALASFASFFSKDGRGQHLRSLALVDAKSVYALPNTVRGPSVHVPDLARALCQLRHLTHLDIRGIVPRGFTAWSDHLLLDVAHACPALQSLRIGAVHLTTWEAGWWAPLQRLEEFVVGSRREDAVWLQPAAAPAAAAAPSGTAGAAPPAAVGGGGAPGASSPAAAALGPSVGPLTLPEDFFAMVRGAPALLRLKLWVPLTQASFTALLFPTTTAPTLEHLSINAQGNTDLKPLDDAAKEAEATKDAPPAKGAGKGGKGGAKQQEAQAEGPKAVFPALRSVVLCDVRDRPEFAVEVMVKMMPLAPAVQNWSVANTHRNAPGKAPPPAAGRGRGRAAQ